MPPALLGHASPNESIDTTSIPPEAMEAQSRSRREREAPAVCPTDDHTAVPKRASAKSKQSLDYVWRSGLAGGLAGCAVSFNYIQPCTPLILIYV